MEIDKSNMRQVIIDSANQLKEGLALAESVKVKGPSLPVPPGRNGVRASKFENVIICGMGGSTLPADLLKAFLKTSIPVYIHKDYGLPSIASKRSLVVCISYSGNTEETLSALEEALEKKLSIFGVSAGGALEQQCKDHDIPFAKIPSGIQPRSAIGYIFGALVKILANAKITEDISGELLNISETLPALNNKLEAQGKELAKKVAAKIPIIYASNTFKEVAQIWKIKFNENAKIPSFSNYFPELNHNEMVGFSTPERNNNFHVIILKNDRDHPRTVKRIELFAALANTKGIASDIIETENGSLLFKCFALLLLGDWVSYYTALENNVDPTPVAMVEEFKEQMNK